MHEDIRRYYDKWKLNLIDKYITNQLENSQEHIITNSNESNKNQIDINDLYLCCKNCKKSILEPLKNKRIKTSLKDYKNTSDK